LIKEISNNTGYLPLYVYINVVLMTDYKLYVVLSGSNTLSKIKMSLDYVIDLTDFTNAFVKINSEVCEIFGTTLHKIPVTPKNSHNICSLACACFNVYCYVDVDGKLIIFNKYNHYHKIADNDVDNILYCEQYFNVVIIIYEKNNKIICYKHSDNDNILAITRSHIINYDGSLIIKTLGDYVLDSDNTIYEISITCGACTITKKLSNIIDFTVVDSILYILNSEREIYQVDIPDYNMTYICDNSYFKKRTNNTKSAANKN
jgi:hypothetical protein